MSTAAAPYESAYWVPTSDGHELHVRRAGEGRAGDGTPGVLFLPGLFADGTFFLGTAGRSPADVFLAEGYAVHAASLRGHGPSRRADGGRAGDWNFDTYVRHDIPDLVRAVSERHPGPLFLLAHSMAGYAALAALGVAPELQRRLAGVVTLSSAVNDYSDGGLPKRAQILFAATLSRLVGRFPARALKQGRFDEPAGLMRQFADWAPRGGFHSADGATDYWAALAEVTLPALVGVGAADTFHASPARARKLAQHLGSDVRCTVFGRESGLSWDPGHVDVVRGRRAAEEVLPRLVEWMRRTLPADGPAGAGDTDTTAEAVNPDTTPGAGDRDTTAGGGRTAPGTGTTNGGGTGADADTE
ncbi:lysophospholipase [Streptomyces sp. SHP 1-2]|uniref:lysophospholipase n=1 Tax=Streptomyces sp. SHP 1-2 TaxID=2769489 RepID=UPI00223849ED|nr:lysophospholipase [Streptomyces sp. SHP 1-2]MCW5253394.1 alpha/beta fold hydrolase [Streptomyces sp. SHP 1-2]